MASSRLTAVAAATLAAACAFAGSAEATPSAARCAKAGYSYAGVQTIGPARGLSAQISLVGDTARVTSGHVAGWIGVGGADAWLQVGISSLPDGTTELYDEVAQPGSDPVYTALGPVAAGDVHRIGVSESSQDVWTVWLDGAAASPGVTFPGSHGSWSPMALEESYDGGVTSCNAYTFRFGDLKSSTTAGVWQPLTKVRPFVDSGHSLRTLAGTLVVGRK